MADPAKNHDSEDKPEEPGGGFTKKPQREFLNYFGKDRWIHLWLAEKRTRLVSAIFPPFVRLGLVPDTVSYVGIALLAGVVLYFVREPRVAVLFLAGHLLCDGLDGAYARHTGKASQAGAFTDLVCDQLGMVVVAMTAIFHHLVPPLLGTAYITLYLIVVVFGVIINVMGLGTRITITSKYFMYATYGVWAGWGLNFFSHMMSFFSVIMLAEVIVGYLRLKRGIRKKFDSEVRFTEGDPYSGKLNYALNLFVPLAVLTAILLWANIIPLRAMFARPTLSVSWEQGVRVISEDEASEILGLGVMDDTFLVLVRLEDGSQQLRRLAADGRATGQSFAVPEYVRPACGALPLDGGTLLIVDSATRLLMGVDLEASFSAKRAVTVFTIPLGILRVTALATGHYNGRLVWLAGNYLYTRQTYVIDPEKALKSGDILGGVIKSYTNGAFPAGMAVTDGTVVEFNKTPLECLIYVAPLKRLLEGVNLLDASRTSFLPPAPDAIGPLSRSGRVVMVDRDGRIYRLPVEVFSGKAP